MIGNAKLKNKLCFFELYIFPHFCLLCTSRIASASMLRLFEQPPTGLRGYTLNSQPLKEAEKRQQRLQNSFGEKYIIVVYCQSFAQAGMCNSQQAEIIEMQFREAAILTVSFQMLNSNRISAE